LQRQLWSLTPHLHCPISECVTRRALTVILQSFVLLTPQRLTKTDLLLLSQTIRGLKKLISCKINLLVGPENLQLARLTRRALANFKFNVTRAPAALSCFLRVKLVRQRMSRQDELVLSRPNNAWC
jgi:hypothetical protein